MDAWSIRAGRLLGATAALALALAALVPAGAGAAVSCNYEAGAEVLQVAMSADKDASVLSLGLTGRINVSVSGSFVACSGGVAALSDTDAVTVVDSSSGGSTTFSVRNPAAFAPTTEIIDAPGGGSRDVLKLEGTSEPDSYAIGTKGIVPDGANLGIVYFGLPDVIAVEGNAGADLISGQGGFGSGEPLSGPVKLELEGDAGADTLRGGEGEDDLNGGPDGDVLAGEGGDDVLIPDQNGSGDDSLDGGAGEDVAAYTTADNGVTVDLGLTGPQPTGEGSDTIAGIEDVWGTLSDDVLSGDDGANELLGFTGFNRFDGRGGNDLIEGGPDGNVVSYAGSPAAVAVDLEAGTAGGGEGSDTLIEIQDAVGSRFADRLSGDENANELSGGPGSDVVRAGAGDDIVEVRDGDADDAACGTGSDHAVADRLSLDTVAPDCEQIDALPEPKPEPELGAGTGPAAAGGGGLPAAPGPDTKLDFRLGAAGSQRVLALGAVVVRVRCPEEACSLVAGVAGPAKLKPKKRRQALPPGPVKTLRLGLTGAQRRVLGAQLATGRRPKLKVTVLAGDRAGNQVRRLLSVTARP